MGIPIQIFIYATKSNSVYVCLSVFLCVCLSVCLNSSETDRGTNIKLGTIDHHPVLSVISVFVMSSLLIPFGALAHYWLDISSVNAFANFDMDIIAFASLFRFIRFTKSFLLQMVTTFIHSFILVT